MNGYFLKETSRGIDSITPESMLLKERKLFFTEEVNSESCNTLIQYLLCLEAEDPDAEIVCIAISAKFSSCYQNACIAAADFAHVSVVDSMNLSTGIGLVVLEAAELAQEGKTGAEIAEHLQKKNLAHLIFVQIRTYFLFQVLKPRF